MKDFSGRLKELLNSATNLDERLNRGKADKFFSVELPKFVENTEKSNRTAWETYKKQQGWEVKLEKKWRAPKALVEYAKKRDREQLYEILLANEADLAHLLSIVDKYQHTAAVAA